MSERTFDLAVVMAGAVSGGAYQGGVMDFLIQALDAWEDAPKGDSPVGGLPLPDHRVVLRGFAGTSAGSYTAAIAAVALRYEIPPVTDAAAEPSEKSANPFFEAWVNRVDMAALLGLGDFEPGVAPAGRQVLSLLDCTAIDATVDDLLDGRPKDKSRAWVAETLAVRMTLGNLRGVPYGFALGHGTDLTHQMTLHADSFDFALAGRGGAAGKAYPDFTALVADNSRTAWQALGMAAKASAAFPFALRPRLISRPVQDYAGRTLIDEGDGATFPRRAITVPPLKSMPDPYAFMAMDGGIMNNEPLDLGRALLLDTPEGFNPRAGDLATRAVVMIDPFIDPVDLDVAATEVPLPNLLMPLFNAWKAQCRFRPDDLVTAGDKDIFSRFIIAPRRSVPPCPPGQPQGKAPNPLASGGLGAFLGFFDRAFRVHDFQLGRRNAQQFLRRGLALPATNPVVAPWWDSLTADQRTLAKKVGWAFDDTDTGQTMIPLVPLMPTVAREILEVRWPSAPDAAVFRDRIGKRLDRVIRGLQAELGVPFLFRQLIGGIWKWLYRSSVLDRIVTAVNQAYRDQWFPHRQ